MHEHWELIVRAKTPAGIARHTKALMRRNLDDGWCVGGRWRTWHDPACKPSDKLYRQEFGGLIFHFSEGKPRGMAWMDPFAMEHESDVMSFADPRAGDVGGRLIEASLVLWRGENGDRYSTKGRLPADLRARIAAEPDRWWLVTVDAHT